MDLDPFAQWETRPGLVLLLLLLLTVPSFVTTFVAIAKGRSSRTRTRRPLARRLRAFARRLRRKPLASLWLLSKLATLGFIGMFLGLTLFGIYHSLANALLQRPYGTPLALGAIALGAAAAASVALRPRPRAVLIGTAIGTVVMVAGAFLFTVQFSTASGAESTPAPGAAQTRTPDAPSEPAPETPSPSATETGATEAPSTPPTAVPYAPESVVLPNGTYETTPICNLSDDTPLTVVVGPSGAITASTSAGGAIKIGDAMELRDCDVPSDEERLMFSHGAPVHQLDGTEWTPDADEALGVIATLTARDGMSWTWVYRLTDDGGLRTGLVESSFLSAN